MHGRRNWKWMLFFMSLPNCVAPVESDEADDTADAESRLTVCDGGSGKKLFEVKTLGGNGRTCASCHRSGSRTISPAEAQALFQTNPDDPLFQGDAADGFGSSLPVETCLPVS